MPKLSYEECLELKDAGFPFVEITGGMHVGCRDHLDFNPKGLPELGAQHFFRPTLEELIEALPEGTFLQMVRAPNGLCSVSDFSKGGVTQAPSLIRAVKILWILLNKE